MKNINAAQIAQNTIEKIQGDEQLQEYLWDAIAEVMEEQGLDIANKTGYETAMGAFQKIVLKVAG